MMKVATWSNTETLGIEMIDIEKQQLIIFVGVENNLQGICSRGFQFRNDGMEFYTGNLNHQQLTNQYGQAENVITLIYSELAIGN
jgi:hypothetical protein